MKHTIIITGKDGDTTLILCELNGLARHGGTVAWSIKDRPNASMVEFATEDESRAAYDKINEGLEAWLGRNDPVKLSTISHADFRYEVMSEGFCAHGEVHKAGDVIEYDHSRSAYWSAYMVDPPLLKRVPK